MIKPTVGRVVLLFRSGLEDPVPALICRVWGDRMINVGGFDENGSPIAHASVVLVQDGDERPNAPAWAEWMPYQNAVPVGRIPPVLHAVPDGWKPGDPTAFDPNGPKAA